MSSTSLLKALHGLVHCKVVFCTLLQKGIHQKEHSYADVGYFARIFNTLPNFFSNCTSLVVDRSNATVLNFIWPYRLCSILTVAPVLSVIECMHAYKRFERIFASSLVATCLNMLYVSRWMKT